MALSEMSDKLAAVLDLCIKPCNSGHTFQDMTKFTKKIRVCFLDIDGVLNFAPSAKDLYYDKHAGSTIDLDDRCIECLKSLVEKFSDLKIVWSTSWRMYDGSFWRKLKNPVKHLEAACSWLRERIIGVTPKRLTSERWHEVKWWLDANASHGELAGYVILDDLQFPVKWFGIEKHAVKIDPCQGFTKDKLQQAIDILESGGGYVAAKLGGNGNRLQ